LTFFSLLHILKRMTQHDFDLNLTESQQWKRLSPATKRVYIRWLKRFATYYRKNSSDGNPHDKIMTFLSSDYSHASAHTLRQATAALTWFYRHICQVDMSPIRIKTPYVLPVRFQTSFLATELKKLPLKYELMGWIFAGSGLLLHEAVNLTHEKMIRHPKRHAEYLIVHIGKSIPIPLCREASRIYHAIRQTANDLELSVIQQDSRLSSCQFELYLRAAGFYSAGANQSPARESARPSL